MKLLLILALIINITGYGDIPAEGMEITLDQPATDFMTGQPMFKLNGTLNGTTALNVTITRSETDLDDEFCCAGQCIPGNGELSQSPQFTFSEESTSWFVHYSPKPASNVSILYTFTDGTDSRELRVNYVYDAESIETVTGNPSPITRKILRDGIIYIETENNIYHL